MAQQISTPLARMIQKLKEANIFDRTVIAVFCVDGSREAKADSYGNFGKNTVLLAGGKIRGGYYGDIRVASDNGAGHEYSYHAPELTSGSPTSGSISNAGRIAGKHVWRTIMRALGVPDALCNRFPDVANVAPLPFLLRAQRMGAARLGVHRGAFCGPPRIGRMCRGADRSKASTFSAESDS